MKRLGWKFKTARKEGDYIYALVEKPTTVNDIPKATQTLLSGLNFPLEKGKDVTVSEALNTKKAEPKKDEPRMVPEAVFLEVKNELKDLRQAIKDGATKSQVSATLKSIADEWNLDENFLTAITSVVKAETKAEFEQEFSSKLKPIEDKERQDKIDKAFNEHFSKAMEDMPEYDGVVNKDVVKTLSLDPHNANKTFAQLIEESYGHLVQGKRTLDPTTTRGGKNDNLEVDIEKAQKDPAYFKEIMRDPILKKKYNDGLLERLSKF